MRTGHMLRASAALLLAGCNPLGLACTEIGCSDGLQVRFQAPPAGAYRVEAVVPGAAAPAVFECASGQACPSAFFDDLVAERVTIRVVTAAGTRSQEFTPRYESQYPNGRRCGAACRQATVTMQV
jgi:hypothetical protein